MPVAPLKLQCVLADNSATRGPTPNCPINTEGIRDLIVVSRTILTTTEKLVVSQEKFAESQKQVTEQIKELREAQAATDEKLNILIDTVDRIIRRLGKNGTKE